MSVQSDRKSDCLDNMLQQNSYQFQQFQPWNRNSVDNHNHNHLPHNTYTHTYSTNYQNHQNYTNYDQTRRLSNQGRILNHTCDCYPSCKGEECPCFYARTEMCIKEMCCEGCIKMKNKILMNGMHQNMHENHENEQINGNQMQEQEISGDRKFCTCKKTKCNKKYCSCFSSGIKCSSQCQCEGCINCDMPYQPKQQERPPSFYNQEELANMKMPDRMSFEKFQFNRQQ